MIDAFFGFMNYIVQIATLIKIYPLPPPLSIDPFFLMQTYNVEP